MRLYHLTPRTVYEEHIEQEGLKPQPVKYKQYGLPKKAVFCWPKHSEQMIKDWIMFSKLKNRNAYDDYVLLEVDVPERDVADIDVCHSLDIDISGSHGLLSYSPHKQVDCCLVTKRVKPENIKVLMNISTYNAELVP